jgi:hypothetical protein
MLHFSSLIDLERGKCPFISFFRCLLSCVEFEVSFLPSSIQDKPERKSILTDTKTRNPRQQGPTYSVVHVSGLQASHHLLESLNILEVLYALYEAHKLYLEH